MKRELKITLVLYIVAFFKMHLLARIEPKSSCINRLCFTENNGQVHDQNYKTRSDVLFSGNDGSLSFHLKIDGISYQLNRVDAWKDFNDPVTKKKNKVIDKSTIYRVDINWLNSSASATIQKGKALAGFNNYYLENCPNGALNVKSFEDVTYKNIYNGIDLKWYQHNGHLKYDYIVAAGVNYKQIQLEFKGATGLKLNNKGELEINTPLGTITEEAPIAIQEGKVIKSKWLISDNKVSFEIDNLDNNLPFIIDPTIRLWGTYYGGNGTDYGRFCATDASGNVYASGDTDSNTGTVIATIGSHQTVLGGGNDAYLVKFNSSGVRQWSTYYGGVFNESGYSCTTDAAGNVYLTGGSETTSGTVIATVGSHQSNFGGVRDAFLVKFNSSGVRQWGTYYGGTGVDMGLSCVADATGNVFMCGITNSSTGTAVATFGSHQAMGGIGFDGFLVKFNNAGVRQWGTYYGGTSYDESRVCCVDATGNIYMCGTTQTNIGNVIASPGSHQTVYAGGDDAFLVKFNTSGARIWGTYYGGSGTENGMSCVTDGTGNIYLSGVTSSGAGTVIATAGIHQSVLGGLNDAFLVKFNNVGIRLWGTYYGGTSDDYGFSCSTDASGNVYLGGYTSSSTGTIIANVGAYQTNYGGGISDAFLTKLNSSGLRVWGTYFGGSLEDQGWSCNTDLLGNVYLTGQTDSNNGNSIASTGAHQSVYGGSTDAFLTKIKECIPLFPTASVNSNICAGSAINLNVNFTGTAIPTYSWSGPNTFTSSNQNPSITSASNLNLGIYTVLINNDGCIETATTQVIVVNPLPNVIANTSNPNYVCIGQTATLTANGAATYIWNPGGPGTSITVSPNATIIYTVTGTNINGCTNTAIITQSVDACAGIMDIALITTNKIKIFPNPTSSILIIELQDAKEKTTAVITNALGQILLHENITSIHHDLNISNLPKGVYYLEIQTVNTSVTRKVIKE